MSSASEKQSLIAECESDGTVKELCKQPKASYTREFLISLAELDSCKKLPFWLDPSVLGESGDESNCLSESLRDSDSGKCDGILPRHSWQHDGLLGAGAFPKVSGCLAGASAPGVYEKGCLLHRSDVPYRPPRPHKAVPHVQGQINGSYDDETFKSFKYLRQEIKGNEKIKESELTEPQKQIQGKEKKVSDNHEGDLDTDKVAMLEDPEKDKRPADEYTEPEKYTEPPASNNNFASRSSIEDRLSILKEPPGFTSRIFGEHVLKEPRGSTRGLFEEHIERKSLTHSSTTKPDNARSLVLCSSAVAFQSGEEEGNPGSGISGNMGGGPQMYGMLNGMFTNSNHLLSNGNELSPKLTSYTSQSTKNGISEQLCGCNKPIATTEVHTCGNLELSLLSRISENGSTLHHYEQDTTNDTVSGEPNSANRHDASRHLLTLLQKDMVLKDFAAPSDKSPFPEVQTDSNVTKLFSQDHGGDTQEALLGTSFTKDFQLTDAPLFLHKSPACRVADVRSPGVNSFFPSKVDEYGTIVVNQEVIMSSSYKKQTGLSEMQGNKQESDAILAKLGSKVKPNEGLKLDPVREFEDKSDSSIEICWPDEESLITFDDYSFLPDEDSLITVGDFSFLSDENSVQADLFNPTVSQVANAERPTDLNVTLGDENSSPVCSEQTITNCTCYGLMSLEASNHTRHAQQYCPQSAHRHPYAGEAFLHSLPSETHLDFERNSMKAKTYPCNHSTNQFCRTDVLPPLFQHTFLGTTMLDHPVNQLLLQQMSMPGELSPHQLNVYQRCVTPDFPINQIAPCRQQLIPGQDLWPTYEHPDFAGLGMPNQYCIDPHVARDTYLRKLDALFGEELCIYYPKWARSKSLWQTD